MKYTVFNTIFFIIFFLVVPVFCMQKKIVKAIVISSEPVIGKVYSPKLALEDIDKRVLCYALQTDTWLRFKIEKHQFLIQNLHLGKNPTYKRPLKNPFVIQVTVHLGDNSDLARYITDLYNHNQMSQLNGNYTKSENQDSFYRFRSTFYSKDMLLAYLDQLRNMSSI